MMSKSKNMNNKRRINERSHFIWLWSPLAYKKRMLENPLNWINRTTLIINTKIIDMNQFFFSLAMRHFYRYPPSCSTTQLFHQSYHIWINFYSFFYRWSPLFINSLKNVVNNPFASTLCSHSKFVIKPKITDLNHFFTHFFHRWSPLFLKRLKNVVNTPLASTLCWRASM